MAATTPGPDGPNAPDAPAPRPAPGPTTRHGVGALLEQGVTAHRRGDLDAAEAAYRAVLAARREHPDALHLLGTLEGQRGKLDLALGLVRRAIAAAPRVADFHGTLGGILADQGKLPEAIAAFEEALRLDRRHVGALNNLAVALRRAGRHDEAEARLREALAVDPGNVAAHNNMGILLERLGRRDEAIDWYGRAVALDPTDAKAQANLGNAQQADGATDDAIVSLRRAVELAPENVVATNNLAVALQAKGDLDEALVWFDKALALEPESITAILNRARCLKELNRLPEALEAYSVGLALSPNDPNALVGYGAVLRDATRPFEALPYLERARDLAPDSPNSHGNLGMAYVLCGRIDDGIAAYDRALELQPDSHELAFSRSLALGAAGRLAEAWDTFDHGFDAGQRIRREFEGIPEWDGSDPSGKTILVWREQGLGDEILYASMVNEVLAAGASAVVDTEFRLLRLWGRSFPAATIRAVKQNTGAPGTPLPPHVDADAHVASGTLMRHTRRSLAEFPSRQAFIVPDPDRVLFWKARLARLSRAGDGPLVGISWRSRSTGGLRGRWYTSLADWAPILTVPGVRFVNLQYDDCSAELAEASERFGVTVHTWDDVDLMADLDDVAALTAGLDLVISAANAVAVMAGSIGVPTWQFDVPDDYSMLGMAGYLWLPSIRRFTRAHDESWDRVVDEIGDHLRLLCDRTARHRVAARPA